MLQTVNGKINKIEAGNTLIHEHISCVSNHFLHAFGKEWLNRDSLVDYAAEVLKLAKEKYSLNLLVDGTVMELGRDAALLREVSKKSSMHIIASTGFYLFHDFAFDGITHTELADLLVKECAFGMDGTDVKPGILKCAGDKERLSDELIKKHSCIGIVQKETGLPVYVHCEHKGNIVFEQIDLLVKNGANIQKLIIGHSAKRPDFNYLKNVLNRGCYVSVDQTFFIRDLTHCADFIIEACNKGYSDKLLVSNDYCIHSDFSIRNKNGFHLNIEAQALKLCDIFERLYKEFIILGGKPDYWKKITTENPINALTI